MIQFYLLQRDIKEQELKKKKKEEGNNSQLNHMLVFDFVIVAKVCIDLCFQI